MDTTTSPVASTVTAAEPAHSAKNRKKDELTPMAPSRRQLASARYVPLRARRDSYESELSHLSTTYSAARQREGSELHDALRSITALPTWYVGNGGTMAVAHYAAGLHNYRSGRPSVATTSLGYLTSRVGSHSAVVVISAGAKHPD